MDGALASSTSVSNVRSNAGYWRIGADTLDSAWTGAPTSAALEGTVDDGAVYPSTLSAAGVTAHYSAGR